MLIFSTFSVSITSMRSIGIPISAVGKNPLLLFPETFNPPTTGNAKALTEEGNLSSPSSRPPLLKSDSPDLSLGSAINSAQPLPSPNKRFSLTPGGTTKVLADLQTGVVNARNALENTKAQLRMSQRTVASLTRQTEDLKEARERLRLENEGLNNVVARKERLLQEVNLSPFCQI